tara:strand:- start:1042 stop:1164 length:123 start_codon:yes stop_codon:yes gene_type:complete
MPHPMKKKSTATKKRKAKESPVMKALRTPVKLPFKFMKWE